MESRVKMPLKTSTKQPDGKPQVGLFDSSLKDERKTMFKMVFIVSRESKTSIHGTLTILAVLLPHHLLHVHRPPKYVPNPINLAQNR